MKQQYHLFSIFLFLLLISSCKKDTTSINPGINSEQFIWNVSSPEAQGMNTQLLDSALEEAENSGFIDGLLVIPNGFIVAERYYNEYEKNRPHNIKSDSKSFLSALSGIALQKGYLDSLEEKVLDYFPEYIYPGMDPRKYNISIKHLLTMRMGIDREEENLEEVLASGNWIKAIIELPLLYDPGERMRYSSCQTHLLSAILTRACNMSTRQFARLFLTNPMGITIDDWMQDPQGNYFGGSEMYFTPREMAVLGYMYLKGGRLNGKQIVPAEWVEFTLTPSTNNPANEWGAWKNYNYAYLWWLGEMNDYDLFLAYGYGGQFIACFPQLELIVVSTADFWVDADTSTIQEWAIFDIISQYILPSVNN
jgi:CubicO group peptidase (beta-lactamase class C family)